jgi:ubiquinone/menaquinone biosynthesis C-methylase UbiE
MERLPMYFRRPAAAYVRGRLGASMNSPLFTCPLDTLADEQLDAVIQIGTEAGLRLHRFKRAMALPRVRRVLGILHGMQPANLLDIGSGRGAFLWPLLDALPALPVTSLDVLPYRVDDVQAVRAGGMAALVAALGDATALPFAERAFDVVTLLEVLEHIPDAERALAEVCRVARRFVILSVPSHADNNPEHIHLFDEPTLTVLLKRHGAERVAVAYVLNHMITVARVGVA